MIEDLVGHVELYLNVFELFDSQGNCDKYDV